MPMPEPVARRRLSLPVVCLLFTVLTSLFYWSPLLRAEWSMADDHDIFRFIGEREHLPLLEMPNVLATKTEIGAMGSLLRFRPSYFALTVLQSSIFGKHPSAWYAFHIAMAVIFASVLCLVALRVASPIVVLGFMGYELSRPYWGDIFARLGAGEAYAALGLAIIAVAVMTGLRRTFTGGVCAAVAVGLAIAAGSKENFVLLTVVPVWLLSTRPSHVTVTGKVWLVIGTLYSLFIGAVAFRGVSHAGHDFYLHPISIGHALQALGQTLQQMTVWIWVGGVWALWLTVRLQYQRGRIGSAESLILNRYIFAVVLLLIVYASQIVFYSGQDVIDNGVRYLFPQALAKDFALLLAATIVLRVVDASESQSRSGVRFAWISAACFLLGALPQWNQNRLSAVERVEASQEWTKKVQDGVAYLKDHPTAGLILNSHHPLDIEPVQAIVEMMRSEGVVNPIAIQINGYSSRALEHNSDPLLPVLARQLENFQASGLAGGRLEPIASISTSANCYSFGLNGQPATQCERTEIAWPPGRFVVPTYSGGILSFRKTGNGLQYLESGWSQPEEWGVWSDGPVATVVVKGASTAVHENMELVIRARGFVAQRKDRHRVHVRINDREAGVLALGWDIGSTRLAVPSEALQSNVWKIDLVPDSPLSPALLGRSSDRRRLGIGLASLQLRDVETPRRTDVASP
jgi:hypothetical protein